MFAIVRIDNTFEYTWRTYLTAMADSNAAAERAEREERLASDLEEVEAKLNNCRENVETLMLQVKE